MHVLRKLHDALAPGAVVADTQPVQSEPPVFGGDGARLGLLDMREWPTTIAAVDARVEEATRAGLFQIEHEERLIVNEAFDSADEFLATVADWQDTRIPPELERRIRTDSPPFTIPHDVRLRLFSRLG